MANSPAPGRAPCLARGAGRALERPSGRPPRGPSTCCPEVAPGVGGSAAAHRSPAQDAKWCL